MEAAPKPDGFFSGISERLSARQRTESVAPDASEAWLQEHQASVSQRRSIGRFIERSRTYDWLEERGKTSRYAMEEVMAKISDRQELSPDEVGVLFVGALDIAQAKLDQVGVTHVRLTHPQSHVETKVIRATKGEVEEMGYVQPQVEESQDESANPLERHTLRVYLPRYTVTGEGRRLIGITERTTVQEFRPDGTSVGPARVTATNEVDYQDLASFTALLLASTPAAAPERAEPEPPPRDDSEENQA